MPFTKKNAAKFGRMGAKAAKKVPRGIETGHRSKREASRQRSSAPNQSVYSRIVHVLSAKDAKRIFGDPKRRYVVAANAKTSKKARAEFARDYR